MKMRYLLLLGGLAVAGFGCARADRTPTAVIHSFYQALQAGDLAKADTFYAEAFRAHDLNFPTDLQEYVLLGEVGTMGHTLTAVDVSNEQVEGDHATVDVLLHYREADPYAYRITLVREKDGWKIGW